MEWLSLLLIPVTLLFISSDNAQALAQSTTTTSPAFPATELHHRANISRKEGSQTQPLPPVLKILSIYNMSTHHP